MKKIFVAIGLIICTSFAFSEEYDNYEKLYMRVSQDSELNKLVDWEETLSKIWSYAVLEGVNSVPYEVIIELLKNPTDFDFELGEEYESDNN